MRFDDIKLRLVHVNTRDLQSIADETGIHFGTLLKIKYGQSANPRIDTIERLGDYLEAVPQTVEGR